jgi:small redox-active disulfide protein 2
MTIQVLGTGCAKCKALEANAEKAVRELALAVKIGKITDLQEIMKFQVMSTPGLVIDGELKAVGRVLSADEIKRMLAE